MEERRRSEDKNWELLIGFIGETREFRKNIDNKLASIEEQTKKTNGRVNDLEAFREVIETKIQDRKDANANWQGKLAVLSGIVAAVAAVWAIFKK